MQAGSEGRSVSTNTLKRLRGLLSRALGRGREAALWQQMQKLHPWSYTPTHGIAWGRDGTSFPVVIDRARGCRIWDLRGKEYIDYTMGWGTTVLGYCHSEVQKAVRSAMGSAPLLAYPRPIQAEVQSLLERDFPGITGVAFGKNGSDVCTLAARLCRGYTGRKTILYCGYHGWGDFWAEQHGFSRSSIPERHPALIHRFRFNDTGGFMALFEQHRSDLAGVMLEPSGPWGGNDIGCEPDADQGFLETLRLATRSVGALLVFDEIITGYRYLEGSVQRARGVTPDLTCLGKAIASGMPLSALLARGDIMQVAFGKAHYGPTFQAEAWSFAAAKATIEVFHREPVALHVWKQGEALRQGIDEALRVAGIPGHVKGPPFRMSICFGEEQGEIRELQRTLLQQEILRLGVSIYNNGVMLPSYAHDDTTLERTLEVFRAALIIVGRATRDGSLAAKICIPLLREM
jgi:glutamate-1-semialdehyde 2,1-aminomutase